MRLRSDWLHDFFNRHDEERIFVTNREIVMIAGTAALAVFINLNIAVALFSAFFYLHNKVLFRTNPMRDLLPEEETGASNVHH